MRLNILGSINLDVVLTVKTLPRPGETVLVEDRSEGPGGKGANQAVAAARYGAAVAFHGAVGRDAAGGRLLAGLAQEGVDVGAVATLDDAPTGRAYVMVSGAGENMILVDPGANQCARASVLGDLSPCVRLTQLETPIAAASALFQDAGPKDILILNPAPALAEGAKLLAMADLVVLNEGELSAFAGSARGEVARSARSLISRPSQALVVTLGSAGALIVDARGERRLTAHPAKVRDTTGAGDCFVGVLAAALAEGRPLDVAAALANRAAALSVETPGARGAPLRAVLDAAASGPTPTNTIRASRTLI